jgi:hypothetical protein
MRVYWLGDSADTELWSAIEVWRKAGEGAFAMWLPATSPFNCAFGKLDFAVSQGFEKNRTADLRQKSLDNWDVMRAILETRNRLQGANDNGPGVVASRDLVHIVMTNRIMKLAKHISPSVMADAFAASTRGAVH